MIEHSHLQHEGPLAEGVAAANCEAKTSAPTGIAAGEKRAILFATPTCPNCRIACAYMDKAGFQYEKLMAEENAELARQYGVKQAPTLIVTDGANFEKYAGAGAIKQYVTQ